MQKGSDSGSVGLAEAINSSSRNAAAATLLASKQTAQATTDAAAIHKGAIAAEIFSFEIVYVHRVLELN